MENISIPFPTPKTQSKSCCQNLVSQRKSFLATPLCKLDRHFAGWFVAHKFA